ncbi:MAG TPA: nucleotidyltransferase family protein [Edaphobacter sp.]|nr:nucleotidyltransferase family protein [Edaphobacter sp.]
MTSVNLTFARPALDPGLQFLIECARPEPRHSLLASLADSGLDWPSLLEHAARHGVLPLLSSRVAALASDAVPTAIRVRLQTASFTSARRTVALTSELLSLVQAFGEAGIPVLPFKGPVLAWSIYSSPALREYSDLDLLVYRQHFNAAKRLLSERGYGVGVRDIPPALLTWNSELPLTNEHSGMRVDLHWRPVASHQPLVTPEFFWSSAAPVTVAGRPVLAFAPETAFLYLCLHGTGHGWHSLKWLCDLAHLAHAFPLDWDRILAQSEQLRVAGAVRLGMRLAEDLLGVPCPQGMQSGGVFSARSYAAARDRVLNGWPGENRFRALLLNLHFTERIVDKCRLFWSMLQPTPLDFAWVSLPPTCARLYYFVRLARLAKL